VPFGRLNWNLWLLAASHFPAGSVAAEPAVERLAPVPSDHPEPQWIEQLSGYTPKEAPDRMGGNVRT
jgi:hypothetical protein